MSKDVLTSALEAKGFYKDRGGTWHILGSYQRPREKSPWPWCIKSKDLEVMMLLPLEDIPLLLARDLRRREVQITLLHTIRAPAWVEEVLITFLQARLEVGV